MSYVVTFYTRAIQPIQEFYSTKKQALEAMREDLQYARQDYKGSGYKQKGSVRSGRVTFEHPYYGVDYMVKIEKN